MSLENLAIRQIRQLQAEIEKLKIELSDALIAAKASHGTCIRRVHDAETKLRIAEEALEFYADAGNYVSDEDGKFICAAYQGDVVANKAKAALAEIRKDRT